MNYAYDQASQLAGLTYSLAANPLGNLAYGYDNDGRRAQLSGAWARTSIPSATTSTAVYNVANELTGWNGATLSYDADGNPGFGEDRPHRGPEGGHDRKRRAFCVPNGVTGRNQFL